MLLRSLPFTTRKLQISTFRVSTARKGRVNVHIHATQSVLQSLTAETRVNNLDHGDNGNRVNQDVQEFLKLVQRRLSKKKPPPSSTVQTKIDIRTLQHLSQAPIDNQLAWLVVHLFRTAKYQGVQLAPLYSSILPALIDAREWNGLRDLLKFLRPRVDCSSRLVNAQLRLDLHNEDYSKLTLQSVEADYPKYTKFNRETYNLLIEARIANRDMEGLRQILIQMQARGVEIGEDTHRAILSRMAAVGPNEELENKIVSYLYGINPSIDTVILNHLIRLRSIARDDAVIERYLAMLQRDGESETAFGPLTPAVPDMTTLALLVEHFGRRKNLDGAQRVIDTVDHLGLKPTHELLAHLIYVYHRVDRLQDALTLMSRLLYHLQPPLQRRLRVLLQDLGWEQSDATTPIPLRPNVYIFNALLSFVLQKRGIAAIQPILTIMKYNHVLPDDDTVRIVMLHLSRTEKVGFDTLVQFLHRCLINRGFKPQIRHVNIVFHALLREYRDRVKGHGGWRAAAARLTISDTRDISAASEKPKTMFRALGTSQNAFDLSHGGLRAILISVKESGARQDHATYSLRMFYHARVEKDVESVERLYENMVQLELCPNAYHVAALVDVHLLNGNIDLALQRIARAQKDGVKLHPALYTMVICAFGDAGQPDKGLEVYKQMMANNVRPDIASLDAVVRGYFLVKHYADASTVLQDLWSTVLPEETQPAPRTPLRTLMDILRREERLRYPSAPKLGHRLPETIRGIQTNLRRMAKRDPEEAGPPAVNYFLSKVEYLANGESDSVQTEGNPDSKLE